jgi:hypothetical protein
MLLVACCLLRCFQFCLQRCHLSIRLLLLLQHMPLLLLQLLLLWRISCGISPICGLLLLPLLLLVLL